MRCCDHSDRGTPPDKATPGGNNSLYCFNFLTQRDTKLLITWLVGGRDGDYAIAFMDDLRDRLANRVQLTATGTGPI